MFVTNFVMINNFLIFALILLQPFNYSNDKDILRPIVSEIELNGYQGDGGFFVMDFSNTKEFIEKAKRIHGNKYCYSKVNYKKAIEKVEIVCPKHGVFLQQPNNHLTEYGCKKCAINYTSKNRIITIKSFTEKASKRHNNKYNYSLTKIGGNQKEIIKIICPIHGVFKQGRNNHLNGKGCQKCGVESRAKLSRKLPPGWSLTNWKNKAKNSKSFDSFKSYVIQCWNEEETFYKIGRTFREIKKRFECKNTMPYNYNILYVVEGSAEKIFNYETYLKQQHREYKYTPNIPFNGMYECFSQINFNLCNTL